MVSSLRFILTPSSDSSTSSILYTIDSKRYLFGIPEGTTRAITQRKATASRIDSIFLNNLDYENSMGLPGLLMTLADSDRKYINLFGPENSGYLVATMRGFCKRDVMKLQLEELKDEEEGEGSGMGSRNDALKPFFQDENLKISFIELSPFKKEQREKNHHDSSEAVEITSDSRSSSNSNKRRKLTSQTNSKASSSSITFEENLARLNWTSPNFKPTQLSPRDSQIWISSGF